MPSIDIVSICSGGIEIVVSYYPCLPFLVYKASWGKASMSYFPRNTVITPTTKKLASLTGHTVCRKKALSPLLLRSAILVQYHYILTSNKHSVTYMYFLHCTWQQVWFKMSISHSNILPWQQLDGNSVTKPSLIPRLLVGGEPGYEARADPSSVCKGCSLWYYVPSCCLDVLVYPFQISQ